MRIGIGWLLLIVASGIVGVLRFTIPQPGVSMDAATVYKDLAHLFVGGLFGACILALVDRRKVWDYDDLRDAAILLGGLAFLLTVFEVIAFFAFRG